jgi:hypothetical protein
MSLTHVLITRILSFRAKVFFLFLVALLVTLQLSFLNKRLFARADHPLQRSATRMKNNFPEVIRYVHRVGEKDGLLDFFQALLEKEDFLDSGGVISNMMQAWRKAPQHMVYFTKHEADQMETLIERVALCQGIAPQEKTEWIARAIDYKIQYEIQEEWERRTEWIESPNEIISKVRKLDISQYGKVIGEFPGNSSYVVIVINQFHRGLSESVDQEIVATQREIAAIEDTLIDNGISNVLALEGSELKEIALELVEPPRKVNLVEYQDYLEVVSDAENPLINDLLAGHYGGSLWQEGYHRYLLHTFGAETPELHDKAATFNLLTKELVGTIKDLSFFGEHVKGDPNGSIPKAGLLARLETTLKASGSSDATVEQGLEILRDAWQSREYLAEVDIIKAAREIHEIMWECSIHTRNLFFPQNIEQIWKNTHTNAIIFVVGVYHNQKEPGEAISTLTETFLDHKISHVVIMPHTVQSILDRNT